MPKPSAKNISSIATHWLPNIIAEFQKQYPNIEYELLLGHYADFDTFPISALMEFPFVLLEKNEKADISELLDANNVTPNIRFTTVDDYAVMSMVEKGLGISIMPELILKRTPYSIITKELDVPAFRNLCFVLRDKKTASLAVKKFMEYLSCRNK